MGCRVGRRNRAAATLDFFGHQVVAHLVDAVEAQHGIYPRHFGVLVDTSTLDRLEQALQQATPATVHRRTRFAGSQLEHETLLARDPTGNQLELKAYANPAAALSPADDDRIGDTAD